jgi:hypothetical protein
MAQLLDVARRGRAKTLTAAEVSAHTKLYQTIGKELGMWQTPYTPPAPPTESMLSGFRLDEAFLYMVKKIGHERAAEIVAKLAPAPKIAAPNGNGSDH